MLDISNLDPSDEEVLNLTGKIEDIVSQPSPLYLDWQLRFSNADFDLEGFECSGRVDESLSPYNVPMNLVSFHFLLSIITSSPEQYPFNTISCMLAGGSDFMIQIKGFYTGSVVDVPTARDVELRPLGRYGHISNPFANIE